ncbi:MULTISPECIES: DUF357 domain-containing protein [Methanothermobacter]|uniref:DUF357 domain-containing protein n=1 Tax=Methanothermobacter marburgensis (strain ATCC BAA-927 / DSM 2133 / JCM 14651 / NBRC 100331 / OCM 82 / Marburg) TaxID=79929 RepID=D9PUH8_METTM|nr:MULTISPECIES: DUF357 domain-containing protein [Methanothermobacter]ADL57876.1 conserved hypothetical protein [Methanothermobacter marburgensis str. Marburg]MDI9615408.1 DUF357 domain-containing protein [Methanothermobacter sp.]QEF94254.1 DUF357 domain-containing protein [Methanothermobacter sp. KEPCO-1]WBF10080.1 DUF357 domain-containing protein [Methanothermobacter marburgensis]
MECRERIEKDLDLLEKNLMEMESIEFKGEERAIIERALNYRDDSIYYLKKGDYITSFGCITYAHGLLDGLRMLHGII